MERVVFVITALRPALSAVVEKCWEGVGEQGHTPPYPLRWLAMEGPIWCGSDIVDTDALADSGPLLKFVLVFLYLAFSSVNKTTPCPPLQS